MLGQSAAQHGAELGDELDFFGAVHVRACDDAGARGIRPAIVAHEQPRFLLRITVARNKLERDSSQAVIA